MWAQNVQINEYQMQLNQIKALKDQLIAGPYAM